MHFVITSNRDVSIDGIGVLKVGEPKEVSADELRAFAVMNKVSLPKANLPSFVKVEFVIDENREEV